MKNWKIEFKPSNGRGPWMCYTIEAASIGEAKTKGWRLIGIEGGRWNLAKVFEWPQESAA